jgi:two-component SAPR family response regulator
MNAVFIDDDVIILNSVLYEARKISYLTSNGFTNPLEMLQFSQDNIIDIAFIDIELGKINGIEVAEKLRNIQKDISIVFLTSYKSYAIEAFDVKAQGYLLKPVLKENLEKEIEFAKKGIPAKNLKETKKIEVVTFGNFDIFVQGEMIKFKRSKTKELFAYLIDRKGASITTQEAVAVMWEDVPMSKTIRSMIHNLISDMSFTLNRYDVGDVLIKSWNSLAIDITKIDCDYYKFLKGNKEEVNNFIGEYMSNYSWAENTLGGLERIQEHFLCT